MSSMVSATEALQAALKVSTTEACRHAMGVPHCEWDSSVLETASPRPLLGQLWQVPWIPQQGLVVVFVSCWSVTSWDLLSMDSFVMADAAVNWVAEQQNRALPLQGAPPRVQRCG